MLSDENIRARKRKGNLIKNVSIIKPFHKKSAGTWATVSPAALTSVVISACFLIEALDNARSATSSVQQPRALYADGVGGSVVGGAVVWGAVVGGAVAGGGISTGWNCPTGPYVRERREHACGTVTKGVIVAK